MALKIYEYNNCSTCKSALKYLDKKGVKYEKIPIVDQPPTVAELKRMLSFLKAEDGSFKNLFNTSGVQYRELGIADKIKEGMTEAEALSLLSKNGKLIKRPFALGTNAGTVGFKKKTGTLLMKTGLLLMNLGTPDEPTSEKVAVYLKEFLMDPYVVDILKPLRWFLVNVLVVPRRASKSAQAYRKIWTMRGSPLKFHCEDLTARVREKVGDRYDVRLAMRYQNPSVHSVLSDWQKAGVTEIKVMPLYPQYARASTLSSELKVAEVAKALNFNAKITYLKPFFRDEGYTSSFAEKN